MKIPKSIKHIVCLIAFVIISYLITTYSSFENAVRFGIFLSLLCLAIILYRDVRKESRLTREESEEWDYLLTNFDPLSNHAKEDIERIKELKEKFW